MNMKPSLASCWYPFRSSEVKAIYDNLTPDEASRLKQFSWKTGSSFGVLLSVPLFLLMFACQFGVQYFPQPWGVVLIFALTLPYVLLVGLRGATIRSQARKILCESAYAKEKGFTPENLRLYSFEKSKAER